MPIVVSEDCYGPHSACRKHHQAGRPVHMIPDLFPDFRTKPLLVMATYHYATVEEGEEAIRQAMETAPTVATDDDLYAYREAGIPHFLPAGWVDPTRRT
jgi:hypothetical protein